MQDLDQQIITEAEAYVRTYFQEHFRPDYVYHNFEHISDVVQAIREIGAVMELDEHRLELLQLAALFHDIGYKEGAENHEDRSAEHARSWLEGRGYPEASIATIERIIEATRMDAEPNNELEAIMRDADLSHVGNKTYWDRCAKVRQEMMMTQNRVMSEHEWVDFEIDFLQKHQFFTDVAKQLYGKRKEKHLRQLVKQKLRLNPEMADIAEELDAVDRKKKKKKKKKLRKTLETADADLKQLNLGRGVETMFRTTYRTHVNLSSIADNKANIMLSINAIIISIVVANLVPQFGANPKLILPTVFLLSVCLTALVFAILSTRPKVTQGKFTREDIRQKRSNLLFFGNFFRMPVDDFHWGMTEMIKDSDFLYSSMTRDLYYLGVVLAKKYKFLRICYNVFMYGLILSVAVFAAVFIFGSEG